MSQKLAVRLFGFALLIGLSSASYGSDKKAVDGLLASRPIIEVLQARPIGDAEHTTAYIYDDRIDYYDDRLTAEIERTGKLPAATENGVLFTEIFLTQFRRHPGLYVVQRGWDVNGNCHVLTSELRIRAKSEQLELEPGNTCSGDPCRNCAAYHPTDGCLCKTGASGDKCNHSVTTE